MAQEKILFVNACVRPESRTLELAKHLLAKMPGEVCEVNLYQEEIQPLNLERLNRRGENIAAGRLDHPDFALARQFATADQIVIAAPCWDMLFPAVLRSYLEMITVTGVTFRYTEKGVPAGLCRAKRLYYVTTSGGPIGANSFGFAYVKAMAQGFFGIEDVRLIAAERLDIVGADCEQIMKDAKVNIDLL